MVRSKDECICANMLSDFRLIYKYEAPLKLKSGRTVYPDFDIPSPVNCTAWQPKLRSFLSETSFFAPAEDKCISLVADETEHFYPHQDCLGANRIKTAVLYLTLDWLVIRKIKIQFIIG
ncbi:MAG: hypothetical protein IIY96_03750 [Lachnospiraceae bacterium]|nr:hypothetical protein [Lachnospiraceae bacterium]